MALGTGILIAGGSSLGRPKKGLIRDHKGFVSEIGIESSDSKTQVERLNLGPW